MTAELVKTERADPLALVQLALEKGCSPADLTGLYDLAKRWRDDQAAEAYAKAITGFKSECPRIIKEQPVKNKAGATIYKFARYEDIKLITGPLETKYGIVVSFDLPNAVNGTMSGICRLTVGCHSVETHFSCRVPEVPNANEPQNDGACLSYFKRLSYCAALDIVVAGDDVDAVTAFETIGDLELAVLKKLIDDKHVSMPRFLDYAGVAALGEITKDKYPILLDMLKRKQANGGQK